MELLFVYNLHVKIYKVGFLKFFQILLNKIKINSKLILFIWSISIVIPEMTNDKADC